jgi:hypothetical protein
MSAWIKDAAVTGDDRLADRPECDLAPAFVPNPKQIELARSTTEEKESQLQRLADFHARHAAQSPAMLARLQQAVIDNQNVFDVLMEAVRCCSLSCVCCWMLLVHHP